MLLDFIFFCFPFRFSRPVELYTDSSLNSCVICMHSSATEHIKEFLDDALKKSSHWRVDIFLCKLGGVLIVVWCTG